MIFHGKGKELNRNIPSFCSEVARAIRQTASGKAICPDEVPAELFKMQKKYVRRSPRSSHFPKTLILNSVQIIEQLLLCLTRKQDPSSDHTGKDPSEDRFDISPRAEGVLCALVSPNFDSWSYWRPKRDFIKTWVDIPDVGQKGVILDGVQDGHRTLTSLLRLHLSLSDEFGVFT